MRLFIKLDHFDKIVDDMRHLGNECKSDKYIISESSKLMENVLQLLLACLTFDFIGTAPEESTDDTGTLQIPTAWRPGMFTGRVLY